MSTDALHPDAEARELVARPYVTSLQAEYADEPFTAVDGTATDYAALHAATDLAAGAEATI
jgi:hypothetical protein